LPCGCSSTGIPVAHFRADVEIASLLFKMTPPLLHCEEAQKGVTYTLDIKQARVTFIHPDGHVRQLRRGIRFDDHLTMESLGMSGGASTPAAICRSR
jgi:hypothetical protein